MYDFRFLHFKPKDIYCDNLHRSDQNKNCLKATAASDIHFVAKFVISLICCKEEVKMIHLPLSCHFRNVESYAYTLDIIHLNSQYTTSDVVSGIVYDIAYVLAGSFLHVRFSAPSSSFFRSPFIFCQHMWSALFEPLTYRNEQKTCQIFYLNFDELINPWIYEFLNLSCTFFNMYDAINTLLPLDVTQNVIYVSGSNERHIFKAI